MYAEIISIGDELLVGQVVNTNASWMAQKLNDAGIRVYQITSISDDKDHIFEALDEAGKHARIILITGGLGPTKDDITKKTLAEYFETELVFMPDVFESIKSLFNKFGRKTTNLTREQAMVPATCTPVTNNHGTAPGMWFEKEGNIYVSMPGVPYEMKAMLTELIIPRLSNQFKFGAVVHKTILTQGIPESFLAERIRDWENNLPPYIKLAYLPKPGLVRLRLSAYGKSKEKLVSQVKQKVSQLQKILKDDIFGYDENTLEKVVGKLLNEKSLTLSTAESCTGGSIAQLITSVPGSSEYFKGGIVAYSNEVKQTLLGVKEQSLMDFGAVSETVAKQMAEGVREKLNSDYAIATTGVAGPGGGTGEKPVGTTWIAIASSSATIAKRYQMGDQRERNIQRTALTALNMLRKKLKS
ncbi:MAG: competence/damage-inducible protein A [Bacteroidales bacterium]|nr:competence/damage-inducible protein A [Bacteroidales bacterium]